MISSKQINIENFNVWQSGLICRSKTDLWLPLTGSPADIVFVTTTHELMDVLCVPL